jgi:hypothetical protein
MFSTVMFSTVMFSTVMFRDVLDRDAQRFVTGATRMRDEGT